MDEKQEKPEKAAAAPKAEKKKGADGKAVAKPVKKKKVVREVGNARAYIQSTFNNTIISITDDHGGVLAWSSAGRCGFKGTKKGTPYAAQQTADACAKQAKEYGVRQVSVYVSGPGSGRETAIRALQASGFIVTTIRDVTPIPHNGCRPPKPRRV